MGLFTKPMREILSGVEVTAPPATSNVRSVPLEMLEQNAIRADNRVVEKQGVVAKLEIALENARKELTAAEGNRLDTQRALLRRHVESGALNGISDLNLVAGIGREKAAAE